MYVCNCNGITERMAQKAIAKGAETWDQVHSHFHCSPCCGKCREDLTSTIRTSRQTAGAQKTNLPIFKAPVTAGTA